MSELQIARQLEIAMLEAGSTGPAFPTIVAIGEHGALPHHQPTDRVLQPDEPILIDFGATYQGYRSDITRTVWIGDQVSDAFTKYEQLVRQAYTASLALLSHPTESTPFTPPTAGMLDQAARQVIATAGYGAEFIHTTGHGVGLDIHEQPSLYQGQPTPITPGMVITIEPGIYLTGTMGYRYENTILVTETGYTELTATDGDFSTEIMGR
jgi:Xaa-Pro aminopeptidase